MSKPLTLSLEAARRAVIAIQCVGPACPPELLPTLERTGFIRTLGGVDVYLAARARVPGLNRADLEDAVRRHDVQVVPAVRGCIYLVPRRYAALALRMADLLSRARDARDREKAGIQPGEVEVLGKAILVLLKDRGPLSTDAVRKGLPSGAVRSLGEQGKKVGISSPLPGALRLLEFEGHIERTPDGARLDHERYLWRVCAENPYEAGQVPNDPAEVHARIAEVFFRAAGLGSLKELAAWSGLALRDAKAAAARLDLIPVAVEGVDEPLLALSSLRPVLEDPSGADSAVAFLPFDDNLVALRGGASFWIDPAYHGIEVPNWGPGRPTTLGNSRHMMLRSVVAEGRIAAFWEYDPDAGHIEWRPLGTLAKTTRDRLDALAEETSRFLADELGHGHSFTLDTDDELRNRLAVIRTLTT